VNESPSIPNQDVADRRQQQRFVWWHSFALIVLSLISVASLVTGVTSYRSRTDSSGTTISFTHHTVTTRFAMSAVTVFQLALAFGLVRRSRVAWRAAFTLPIVWAFLVGVVGWPQLYTTSPDWTVVIPLVCLAGIGIWQTFVWRRQWTVCEGLFQ
jgi:magnesium-transporting ATPase (P-type)